MNKLFLLPVIVAASTLLVGCNRLGQNGDQSAQASGEYNYAFDKKEVFVADASNDLAALDQKINELADKAATASESLKTNTQVEIQTLRDQRAGLSKELLALKQATEANWNGKKSDFVKSYNEAKLSCQQAWQRFTQKFGS
jgi:hypothetical protein